MFAPFSLGSPAAGVPMQVSNRLVLAPMTTYSSQNDGTIADDELDYLRHRAQTGFGMIITAACYVHPTGKAFDGQWGADSDDKLDSLAAAAQAIHDGGAMAVLQIHHGGRMAPSRLCGKVLSASDVKAGRPTAETPSPMTEGEIHEVIQAFGDAARRAKQAGFDGVEIHGANTYLLQQFVSPATNLRQDAWGPDGFAFPLAVVDAVRSAVGPTFVVGYRFSPEEVEPGGIDLARTERLIDALCARSLDFLHVSLGKIDQKSLRGDGEEAVIDRLVRHLGGRLPLMAAGGVKTAADVDAALAHGLDLVAVGRAAISEPDWVACLRGGREPQLKVPLQGHRETCVLPAGLAAKIDAVSGWFERE